MINPIKVENASDKLSKKLDEVILGKVNRGKVFINLITYMFDKDKCDENIKQETAKLISADEMFSSAFTMMTRDEFENIINLYCQNVENCMVSAGDIVYCIVSDESRNFHVEKCEIDMIAETKQRVLYHLRTLERDEEQLFHVNSSLFYKIVFFNKEDAEKSITLVDSLEELLSNCVESDCMVCDS